MPEHSLYRLAESFFFAFLKMDAFNLVNIECSHSYLVRAGILYSVIFTLSNARMSAFFVEYTPASCIYGIHIA